MMPQRQNRIPSFAYQDRVLLYLDLLGWSDLVRRSGNDPSAKRCVDVGMYQLTTFGSTHQDLERADPRAYDAEIGVYITQASDSLMISCRAEATHRILHDVAALCTVLLLRAECYVRGALVRGPIFHQARSDKGLIVGPALVTAVELEKAAQYPRILISPDAL